MKKKIVIVLALALVLSLVAGCAKKEDPKPAEETAEEQTEETAAEETEEAAERKRAGAKLIDQSKGLCLRYCRTAVCRHSPLDSVIIVTGSG